MRVDRSDFWFYCFHALVLFSLHQGIVNFGIWLGFEAWDLALIRLFFFFPFSFFFSFSGEGRTLDN